MNKKVILSAVKPSNIPTIGNYLGAIKNWVKIQAQYDCIFFAVDLHAVTVKQDPKELRELTYHVLATYIACGIDPNQALLFVQSQVPEHAELAWILNCHSYMGELSRMTQFKDKSGKEGQNIGAGLFTYPVLMAADILLYQTNYVPVGEDQKQHIELTRDLAIRVNHLYGEDLFTVPEAMIPPTGARIMSLSNPLVKMSKSDEDPSGTVTLDDLDEEIRKKVKRAMTDSGSEITEDPEKPGVRNLLQIQSTILNKSIPDLVNSYVGKQYGHLKLETAEILVDTIKPIREKTRELLKDKTSLNVLLKKGADQARQRANKTLKKIQNRIGFVV